MLHFKKDLQFSLGKLTQDTYSHLARKNPLQKQDTKALSSWIFEERNDLYVMRMLGYHRAETNKAFAEWIKEEHQPDLKDIGDKLVTLLNRQAAIEEAYAAKYQEYRRVIKAIREREDRLSDAREKKRSLAARIAHMTKTSPKSPRIKEFTKELETLEQNTRAQELELGDFKRFALREAFYLRFNAMKEMADKLAIIAGFGKYIVDLLDIEPTPTDKDGKRRPYENGPRAAQILADALKAIDGWKPVEGEQRPTLADHGQLLESDNDSVRDDEPTASGSGSSAQHDSKDEQTSAEQGTPDDPTLPPQKPPRQNAQDPSLLKDAAGDTHVKSHDAFLTDLDKLDLYGPPPAYSPSQDPAVPLDTKVTPARDTQTEFNELGIPKTPVHMIATVRQEKTADEQEDQQPAAPNTPQPHLLSTHGSTASSEQSPLIYSQSPAPIHQQQNHPQDAFVPFQGAYSQHTQQESLLLSQPWHSQYQSDYGQLYHQVAQFQQHAPVLPYAQFQQQFAQLQGYNPYHHRQPVDAGGFRIPPAQGTSASSGHLTAEEEKQALAEHYTKQA